jgi:hypothetical protein
MNTQTPVIGLLSKRTKSHWSADDVQRLIVCGTLCLCLFLYLVGVFWLVLHGIIAADKLGALPDAGVLGIGGMFVLLFKLALKR